MMFFVRAWLRTIAVMALLIGAGVVFALPAILAIAWRSWWMIGAFVLEIWLTTAAVFAWAEADNARAKRERLESEARLFAWMTARHRRRASVDGQPPTSSEDVAE